ncbi:alpha/beta hydrolase fold protein [Calothrix sp. NIES-4101]|nr:alpha/beta hydrolase fold protein [Calothrix sp. NIES-4101]
MKHHQGNFTGVGKINLYYQSWHPQTNPCAIAVIIHGLGSHSGLFGNVVKHLVKAGYAVYALDLRGHGRSQGQRGHINDWSEFRQDIKAFLKLIEAQEPGYQRFLLGHSLGSIIVLDYVLHYPKAIQGAIAMAPPLGQVGVSPVKLTLGRTLSLVMPRFAVNVGFAGNQISRDQNVQETFTQDSLMHSLGSARLGTEYLATKTWIHSHAANLEVPILMLHGGADEVARPEGSRAFFKRIVFPDKEYYEYPQSRHAIHRDLDYQEMLADLEDWLQRHVHGGTVLPFKRRAEADEYMFG